MLSVVLASPTIFLPSLPLWCLNLAVTKPWLRGDVQVLVRLEYKVAFWFLLAPLLVSTVLLSISSPFSTVLLLHSFNLKNYQATTREPRTAARIASNDIQLQVHQNHFALAALATHFNSFVTPSGTPDGLYTYYDDGNDTDVHTRVGDVPELPPCGSSAKSKRSQPSDVSVGCGNNLVH